MDVKEEIELVTTDIIESCLHDKTKKIENDEWNQQRSHLFIKKDLIRLILDETSTNNKE